MARRGPHLPASLEQALISVKDKRFLRHGGIDPEALSSTWGKALVIIIAQHIAIFGID